MPGYHHGVRTIENTEGARPIRTVNSGVIGVVITAPKGPVNTPVLIAGDRTKAAATFGKGIGTAGQVFDAIFKQIGAMIVAVNVLDPATHKTAVAAAEYTFDAVTNSLEVVDDYIYNVVVKSADNVTTYIAGTDYTVDSDTGVITRVDSGAIGAGAAVNVNYDIPDAAAVTDADVIGEVRVADGAHTGLQALLTAKASLGIKPRILGAPGLDSQIVATEIVAIADQLRASAYAYAAGAATSAAAVTYRNNFDSRRLMVIWPDWVGLNADTGVESNLYSVAFALGVRAKIDNVLGWHKVISNVPVNGITGISADVPWDLQDPNTIAGYLNANEVTTLINQSGFRFWGSRTCSSDPLYAFESAARTADILADTIADAHLWAIDKPISKTLIKDIVEGVNAKFRELKAGGYIVDAFAWLDPEKNTDATLAAGNIIISYDYTPVPPLEALDFYQTITTDYLAQLRAA